MKIFRTIRVALAVLASFFAAAASTAAPPTADLSIMSVASQGELEFRFNAIEAEVAAGQSDPKLLIQRIDGLVKQIDQAIANKSGDMLDMIKLRNETLRLRDQVSEIAKTNGVKLIQALPVGHSQPTAANDAAPADQLVTTNTGNGNVISDTLVDERVSGQSVLTAGGGGCSSGNCGGGTFSGATVSGHSHAHSGGLRGRFGAGGGGFGGGGFGGGGFGGGGFAGGGRIGLLGAGIAAAIAIPIATADDNDDNNGGVGSIVSSDDSDGSDDSDD